MSEPTIAELDRLVDYLELALRVAEVNCRATQALLEHERRESGQLRARLIRARMQLEKVDLPLAQRVFGYTHENFRESS
ncbi:MAG TPA: hypothetical protein VFH33_03520 [Candidatus Krumholzibacteria bacterium]|nr:hypothetical protein [Candidatus Krumholzibacteria bacterium]